MTIVPSPRSCRRSNRSLLWIALALALLGGWGSGSAADDVLFAVVTKVGKDKHEVTAQAFVGGTVTEVTLVPGETVAQNLIWKSLEACHSLRAEATKTPEGYQVRAVKVLDAGMLPMPLQGIAGDCLLRKALEFAPLVD